MFKVLNASRMGDVVIGNVVEVWEKGNLVGESRYEVASQGSPGSSSLHAKEQSLNLKIGASVSNCQYQSGKPQPHGFSTILQARGLSILVQTHEPRQSNERVIVEMNPHDNQPVDRMPSVSAIRNAKVALRYAMRQKTSQVTPESAARQCWSSHTARWSLPSG